MIRKLQHYKIFGIVDSPELCLFFRKLVFNTLWIFLLIIEFYCLPLILTLSAKNCGVYFVFLRFQQLF